ncbi:TorF family putative porin [Quatrionicoccus australiensis]|uniref:TorF family putative porin n=1 Tax=Quatrionicoccus australiensis TaxID=138118 RepID=UPI001CF846E8|nr:TorF family putative porin [Quatrionicoccus australiensis]UCV15180.1 TorF family putative porin [Quatrionicoccus australiensis]
MKKSLIALALVGAFAAPAFAEEAAAPAEHTFTANIGAVTNYVFRGITQSQHQPAIQGGVDYAHSSGIYVGTWASSIEWVNRRDFVYQKDNNIELDLYAGYKGAIGDFSYDVGAIRYFYPGDFTTSTGALVTANTTEAYISGSWKYFTLKYNRALTSFIGWGGTSSENKSKGSDYIDLTMTYPIDETLNVIAHIGHQNVKNNSFASYNDIKLGVTKDFGFAVVGLAYTATDADHKLLNGDYNFSGKNAGKQVLAASITKTF